MTNETQTAAPVSLEALIAEARREYRDSDAAGDVLDWLEERGATLRLAQSGAVGAWVSVNDRLPEDGTECLVIVKYGNDPKFYRVIDTWRMQREAPVSFSSATIKTGLMWDDHDFFDVLMWQPVNRPSQPTIDNAIAALALPAQGEGKP